MQPYRQPDGNSGVIACRITPRAIAVQFAGRGLASFISGHVRHAYASKN